MNCNELENYVHEFVDNHLPVAKRAEVANHLASCHRCTIRVAELEEADRQLRTMKTVEPPPNFLQQVRSKISEEQKERESLLEEAAERVESQPQETFWRVLEKRLFAQFWFKVALGGAAAIALVSVLIVMNRPPMQVASERKYQFAKNEEQNRDERQVAAGNKRQRDDLAYKQSGADREKTKSESTTLDDKVGKGAPSSAMGDSFQDEVSELHSTKDQPARTEPSSVAVAKAPDMDASVTASLAREELKLKKADAKEARAVNGLALLEKPAESPASPPLVASSTPASQGSRGKELSVEGHVEGEKEQIVTNMADLVAAAKPEPAPAMMQPPAAATTPAPPLPTASMTGGAGRSRSGKIEVTKTMEKLATPSKPALTNLPPGVQTGWLDLATRIFYLEFGKTSSGAFVRGRLDEKNEFIVTSTEVEGQVVELDAKQAATKGTYGWLGLSSQRFVAARPGLKPSYPYIEGYQDNQGEFHPTSRHIYRAGN